MQILYEELWIPACWQSTKNQPYKYVLLKDTQTFWVLCLGITGKNQYRNRRNQYKKSKSFHSIGATKGHKLPFLCCVLVICCFPNLLVIYWLLLLLNQIYWLFATLLPQITLVALWLHLWKWKCTSSRSEIPLFLEECCNTCSRKYINTFLYLWSGFITCNIKNLLRYAV